MRIFLSYASERRDIAEPIALALRNQGHRVFFDRDDLPPGASYDDRIRDAIAASHLLVFLISPESVADGRYTLTELAVARRRWASPRDRVLPVQIVPTPLPAVPAYLKAVAILEPRGNVAAEVAAATAEIAGRRKRWRWPAAAGAAAALAAAAVAIWQISPAGDLALEAETAERARVGLFGEAPRYLVRGQIHNRARQPLELAGLELDTEPPRRLQVAAEWTLPADLEQRPAGSSVSVALPVSLTGDAAAAFRWRICTRPGGV
jgi:hypothetical protein